MSSTYKEKEKSLNQINQPSAEELQAPRQPVILEGVLLDFKIDFENRLLEFKRETDNQLSELAAKLEDLKNVKLLDDESAKNNIALENKKNEPLAPIQSIASAPIFKQKETIFSFVEDMFNRIISNLKKFFAEITSFTNLPATIENDSYKEQKITSYYPSLLVGSLPSASKPADDSFTVMEINPSIRS